MHDWKADGLSPDQRVDVFVDTWHYRTKYGGGADLENLKREVRSLVHFIIITENSATRFTPSRPTKDHGHED